LWRRWTHPGDRVATEAIGSAKGLYLRLASTTTSRVDPLIRKIVAPAVALALCLAAFVLATSAAWAAEQPSRTAQQGTVESVTIINGTVAEPVPDGTTTPVDSAPVKTAPVKTAPVETTLSVPLPVDSNPGPAPEPTWVPAPERTPDPAPLSITLQVDARATEPAPSTDAAPAAALNAGGTPPPAREPSVPEILPEPDTSRGDDPLPAPTTAPLEEAPATAGATPIATPIVTPAPPASTVAQEVSEPSQTVVPVPSGVKSYLPSGIGEATASAVASAVTSAAADALGSLTGALTEPSTAGTQEEAPLEGTPQPAPPLAPAGGGSYSPATGSGGQLAGWGFAPLLVGILALFAAILMRRDFRTYLISCKVPKPSSALLLPLERPG
jgi:hypothetical protein